MVHGHQLDSGLLIDWVLPHWSSRTCLGELDDDLGLLVLAGVVVELLLTEELLACPPH